MKNNIKNKIAAFALLSLSIVAGAPAAQASTLTYTGLGYGSNVDLVVNTQPETVFAGQIRVTIDTVNAIAYCVDLFSSLELGSYANVQGSPSAFANGGRAAWIVENYALNIASNASAAAVQLALWEVVHDNGTGLSTGSIVGASTLNATLASDANKIIAASLGQSSNNATILYNTYSSGKKAQTLIVYTPPTSEVPEPSSIAMLGIGIVGIGFGVYRKRQTSSVVEN